MSIKDKIIVPVKCCARCEKDHEPMCFLPFKRPAQPPFEKLTHWASCPTTGEPIMLSIVLTESQSRLKQSSPV